MSGKTPKEVIENYECKKKCTYGVEHTVLQKERMVKVDITIVCKSCFGSFHRSSRNTIIKPQGKCRVVRITSGALIRINYARRPMSE